MTESQSRRSLRPAKLRVSRAVEHLSVVETIANEYELQNPEPVSVFVDRASIESDGPVTGVVIDWSAAAANPVAPTSRISVLAGETVYNLRTGLDYLAYELAWLDSGSENRWTQFPIEDREKDFWEKRRETWLGGVSDDHVARIVPFQPFSGCNWSRTLRNLSNRDKHRLFVDVFREFSGQFRVDPSKVEDVPDRPDKVRLAMPAQTATYGVEEYGAVVPLLSQLARSVAEVLFEFQGDFGESDVLTFRD